MEKEASLDQLGKETHWTIIFMGLLSEPLVVLCAWLPFILRKEAGATAFQISMLVALKPIVSLFSFYWSSDLCGKRSRLRGNLVLSGILARLPLMLCVLHDDIWYIVFASAIYMLFTRAGIPAWMEILKLNLPSGAREKSFSLGTILAYVEGMVLALSLGALLDYNGGVWRYLLLASGAIGMVGLFFQARLPIRGERPEPHKGLHPIARLLKPWRDTYHLMRTRPDFARFQAGFMAGGFGIMMISVILPLYFVDILGLTHTQFTSARSFCMAIGFIGSTWIWTRSLPKMGIPQLTALGCILFAIYPLFLIFASAATYWIYIAYTVYGVAQGGSHMLWHLSGPIFAGDQADSSLYSGVNIVMVGIRGLIAPFLAPILYHLIGPIPTLAVGMAICLFGAYYMLKTQSDVEQTI